MKSRFTLFLLSTSGAPAWQFTFSKKLLTVISILCFLFLGLIGAGIYDYYNLKTAALYNQYLKNRLSDQGEKMALQQDQIRVFAGEIDNLKNDLLALNDFEKKIRIVAGLDEDEDMPQLFGIGGAVPEDLAPGADLSKKHSTLIRRMHEQVAEIDTALMVQQKGFASIIDHIGKQRNFLASRPSIRPTDGYISSPFGHRKSPFTGLPEFHSGLDIANREGTKILATADGTVTYAGSKGAIGKMVMINHGYGMATRYGHLSKILKKSGERVKRGETIAEMGNTGRSTGSHVHYEILLNGVPLDPTDHILN